MRISIFWKLLIMVGMTVLILGTAVFFTTKHFVAAGFDRESVSTIERIQNAVQHELRELEEYFLETAGRAAQDHQLASALYSSNPRVLSRYARELMQANDIDFVTFSNAQGEVILRGHSEQTGDVVLSQINVKKALQGEPVAGVEQGSQVGLSLRAGYPVMIFERIVGVLTIGMDLSQNSLVDAINEKLGVEATIFEGDSRLSTTISRDGQRVVGTRLQNPDVLARVLTDSETFLDRNQILGRWYDTAYWPVKDLQGDTVGMYFIGTDRETIETAQKATLSSIMWVTFITGGAMLGAGILFARTLAGPVSAATRFASRVADGNLDETLEIKNKDEIGVLARALNKMVANLKDRIKEARAKTEEALRESEKAGAATREANQAREMAEKAKVEGMTQAAFQLEGIVTRVGSASQEISGQVEQSSRGSEEQKARTAETAAAMAQMNATVMEVARNASTAAKDTDQVRQEAEKGAEIVKQSVEAIGEVHKTSYQVKDSLEELGTQAEQIGGIMNVIDEIADQTNLLALNAAIEAARAGDAGRGFAVVADEVRKLAEKTMAATREVEEAISSIQDGARTNIQGMDQAVAAVEKATDLASSSGRALEKIVDLIEDAAQQVRSIATATEEQSAASEQVEKSIEDIRRIAEDGAKVMERSARAIGDLTRQSQELQDLIRELKKAG
ncbi:methyl-accepting chemotaxis protein [Desulfonatronovibrio hydrogenovorans]|uniref:methyl-accepting chemotaxis protein n=1 Tax=Desulfonatronovibrio hydrogenovorans TaxID=53245 RepID=UPI00048BD299|nr:methyl-accepting chemotaxis protein [Desulfonatronovibrio hydrogenovorans]